MHERISVNSLCFPTTPIEQTAEYWRTLQPSRVSIIAPQLTPETLETVRAAVSGYKLETVSGHLFMLPVLTRDPDAWEVAQGRLNAMIELASSLGAHSIYMLTGGHGPLVWEEAAEIFGEAMAPCVELARQRDIALAIENASVLYAGTHIAHSLRDTVRLAEIANIGVCADLFGCWTEAGLRDSIERAATRSPVVQLSDYVLGDRSLPCRAVPGDGTIPLERLIGWLLEAGYEGCFDLELIGPRIDAEGQYEATRRSCDRVSEILVSLGA
jgi:sugar phosphate isomerase/epimerase